MNQEILSNKRILDLGQVIAGPQCAGLLSDFGAEVIKIEPPKVPDTARNLYPIKDGVSLWWKVLNRNKKSVTLDLKNERGKELFTIMLEQSDVLIENFRPGVLERLGFDWETIQSINPNLIILRISGYGQTGPMAKNPAFGRAAEAFSGAHYLTGFPDGPPVHAGFSLADSITALMGAFGVSLALYELEHNKKGGQVIDLALFETIYKLVEFPVAMFEQMNQIPERKGNRHPGVHPTNTYKSKDGIWVTISAATERTARRVLKSVGGDSLVSDPRFETNEKRVANEKELDEIIGKWMENLDFEEIADVFDEHDVAYAKVYNVKDLFDSEQIHAREDIISVPDGDFKSLKMPGIVPKFSRTPGGIKHTGPEFGEHNMEVYTQLCELTEDEVNSLEKEGVI